MVLLVAGLYRLGVAGMHTVGRGRTTDELAGAFAHTLIPIAFAYLVAHYFSLLAFQGQAIGYLVSDPLGRGLRPVRHGAAGRSTTRSSARTPSGTSRWRRSSSGTSAA